ncbi:MAG: cell division protein FtsL [Gammaproteobacteria bacterium]|mgnify:CR=1 FL=1|jgi:cell division protein FtsL|nr:cell division protein FtsL [Gammaproteobacteria bacterium]
MRDKILFLLLISVVFVSALEVVLYRHETRKLFAVLQELYVLQNELDREWGQLLLEQGTWGTHGRIEDIARDELNMTLPNSEEIYRVRS